MAIRTTKPLPTNYQNLALELTKAALAGGALRVSPSASRPESESEDIEVLNRLVEQRARLDSAYIHRLYNGILRRLEQTQEK